MVIMGILFNTIDEPTTINNARFFFTDTIPKLENQAGHSLMQVTRMDLSGVKSSPAGNSTERRIIKAIHAKRQLRAISEALNQCQAINQAAIRKKYFNYPGRKPTPTRLNKALLEFALVYASKGFDLRDEL